MVVPVTKQYMDYAHTVQKQIHAAGFYVDVETSQRTLNKMVRETQLMQYNFILVVGAKEEENGTVTIRTRDNEVRPDAVLVADLIAEFKQIEADHK